MVTGKLNCEQKKRIRPTPINSTVCIVALYAAETWTLTKASRKLLETFEMWTWRGMLKISWTEVTNEEVLAHANKTSIFKIFGA